MLTATFSGAKPETEVDYVPATLTRHHQMSQENRYAYSQPEVRLDQVPPAYLCH